MKRISVLVPTLRPDSEATLASLRAQTLPADQWEVLLPGSGEDEVLSNSASREALPIHTVESRSRNVCEAVLLAARAASAPLLWIALGTPIFVPDALQNGVEAGESLHADWAILSSGRDSDSTTGLAELVDASVGPWLVRREALTRITEVQAAKLLQGGFSSLGLLALLLQLGQPQAVPIVPMDLPLPGGTASAETSPEVVQSSIAAMKQIVGTSWLHLANASAAENAALSDLLKQAVFSWVRPEAWRRLSERGQESWAAAAGEVIQSIPAAAIEQLHGADLWIARALRDGRVPDARALADCVGIRAVCQRAWIRRGRVHIWLYLAGLQTLPRWVEVRCGDRLSRRRRLRGPSCAVPLPIPLIPGETQYPLSVRLEGIPWELPITVPFAEAPGMPLVADPEQETVRIHVTAGENRQIQIAVRDEVSASDDCPETSV